MYGKGQTIFVIEDEADISELIRFNLTLDNYKVECFSSGELGLKAIHEKHPDLIILDLMLPGISGMNICQQIKSVQETASIPVIMVTAKGEESDVVRGLEFGAEDYITKPFSPKVLTARVGAVLRRVSTAGQQPPEKTISVGPIRIDLDKHETVVDGKKIQLTRSEFQILCKLAARPGWVFTRTQIVEAIRGGEFSVTDRTIDFQLVGLRKKLGEAAIAKDVVYYLAKD